MKPLHVLDLSLPEVAGYTSRARAILEGQAALGLDPIALTGLRQPPSASAYQDFGGVRYHRTEPWRTAAAARRLPAVREAVEMAALGARILELARADRPDVVHAHSPVLCGLPAHMAARHLGVPSVYEIRAFWEDAAVNLGRDDEGSIKYAAVRSLETGLARSVDALVVICEGIRRDLVDRGIPGDKIFAVPNGVEADRFAPAARDEALVDRLGFRDKTVIAYIGTLFRFEGVGLLLEALRRLIDEDDSVRGLVVGHGETEAELRRAHERLGLGDKVVLAGRVPPREIVRHYAIADVLCYPRERHRITELTTPLKPLEAMAMQKAVLASDVGGLRELVRAGETGLLFRAGDIGDLVRAARRLVTDAALRARLGEAARRDVVQTRDWKKLARGYLDVSAAAGVHRARARRDGASAIDVIGP